MGDRSPPPGHDWRMAIIEDLSVCNISPAAAAETFARRTFEDDPEGDLPCAWGTFMITARNRPDLLDPLASLFINLASLPDARDAEGNALLVEDQKVWSEMPMLGIELREEWNVEIPQSDPELVQARSKFANLNRLAALLMKSGKSAFQYEFFAIVAMRNTLETPVNTAHGRSPDFYVPAAAAWIDVIGQEIYRWDYEFPHGPEEGDPGRGGPLWTGHRGFCEERWGLWKKRFHEISESDVFAMESRQRGKEAAARMAEIDGSQNNR